LIITSSTASIVDSSINGKRFDESDWPEVNEKMNAY